MSHAGSTLQLVLELSVTFVFGLNGALRAMEAENLDIVGVVVLAVTTALSGGIIRDLLIGSLPPPRSGTGATWPSVAGPVSPPPGAR